MTKLSDTALTILQGAANEDRGLVPTQGLKMNAPTQNVIRSLLKQSLLIELPWNASLGHDAWRRDEDEGAAYVLKITDEGYRALNIAPPGQAEAVEQEAAAVADALDASTAQTKPASLRDAAAEFLAAWDAAGPWSDGPVSRAVANLRAALAKPGRAERAQREPRGETKQEVVIALLKRPGGATNPEIQEATEWAPHTVRGFFAGLKKKGFTIDASKNPETKETTYRIPN